MQFITRMYGGRQVAVLIGHEEHELMFVTGQIMEIAHVANPSAVRALTVETTGWDGFLLFGEVLPQVVNPQGVGLWGVEARVEDTWLASSAAMYQALLRAESPSATLFRDWVTAYVLPEVRELDPIQMEEELNRVHLSEHAQMAATIRLLERQLSAEQRRAYDLQKSHEKTHDLFVQTVRQNTDLRQGAHYVDSVCTAQGLLDRMQWEQDQLARTWLKAQMRTEVSFHHVDFEERWWRSPRARKQREKYAQLLRDK